jgi:hypothetical protein
MSTRKILIVAFVIAILLIPAYNYDVKKVEAQPSVSVKVISKYPAPHNTTFWLHWNAPIYNDAVTGAPVYDKDTGYIIVRSLGGFSGSISFSLDTPFGWPAGLVVDLPPSTTLAAGETKTLTFNITHAAGVLFGIFTFRVKVTSGAQVFYSNFANVQMSGHFVLFRLKGFPYEITTAAGTTLTVPVLAISQAGYVGTVALSRVLPSWLSQPAGFSVSLDAPDPLYTGGLLKSHGVFEGKVKIAVASTVTPSFYYPYVMAYFSDYIFNGDFNEILTKVVEGKLYPLGWNFTPNVELDTNYYIDPLNPWINSPPYSAKLVAPTVAYTGNVWLRQKIWLPPTSPSYLFTFRYSISPTDIPNPPLNPGDRVWFRIYNTTYNVLYQQQIPSANYTGNWEAFTVDLAMVSSVMEYRGKEIIISFELIHDGDFVQTTVFIDYIRFPFENPWGSSINYADFWFPFGLPVKIVDMLVVQTLPTVSDLSMITGSFKVAGQIIPNGYYGGNVYLSASISPAIPFTSTLSVTGPVNWLYDGDFESGYLANWVTLSDVFGWVSVANVAWDPNVINGTYSAVFLYDSTSSDPFVTGYTSLLTKAPVYVPATATGANITFKYKTSMPPGNIIYDWRLEIINAKTGALLASVGLPLPNETLQTRTVDLLPYKGNYLLFKFKLGELTVDGVRAVYLDDVVVKVDAPVTNQAFIADPTMPHNFEATISLPPVSLGASPEIPPGVYNVTLTFSTDPPYSPAVESGAKGPVKTLVIKVRVIGVEAVQVPAKVTTSGEFDIKLRFKTAAADNLNRTLYFETYNVWVLGPTFTLFNRTTAAKEFGLWIKWDGDVFRNMSFTLPGKGGSTEVTLRLVTQNAKPGIYNIRFFVTSNITGPGEIPTTIWTFGPPPPGGLTYTGAALDFVVRVGDYSISTDTYTLVVPSTGSVEFDVKVKTYVTPFTLSFSGKAYKIELGELVEVKGVSFEFTPSTLSLDADKEATVKVKVKTELATVGIAFIDIVATDGVTTREIQGIKLIIVAGGGSVQEFRVSKGEVKPLSYGESIVKKLPTYEFTVENKENKVVKEYKPISISSDNVREVQVISGYSTIPFNAIALVIATLAAIGIAVFISRKYL